MFRIWIHRFLSGGIVTWHHDSTSKAGAAEFITNMLSLYGDTINMYVEEVNT